ncbi:unnamed protein product [Calypogeia fissa]
MSSAIEETVTTVIIDFANETSVGITLPDRWIVRKRDQKRVLKAVYVDIPLPKRPYKTMGKVVPPPVISVLEIAMPALGYGFHCWDSLHDPIAFEAIRKLLAEAPTTNGSFRTWAEVGEKEMKIVEPPLSSHERCILEGKLEQTVCDSSDSSSNEWDIPPIPFLPSPSFPKTMSRRSRGRRIPLSLGYYPPKPYDHSQNMAELDAILDMDANGITSEQLH